MEGSFDISPDSIQGLGSELVNKGCSVEKDLALVKDQSRRWKLIDLRKEEAPSKSPVIQGKELVLFMKAVANGEKAPPETTSSLFSGKEFHALARDPSFKNLCRLIPGMESPEHVQARARSQEALHRSVKATKIIGKGLSAIEKQGLKGRFVGQDQKYHPYWIKEVVYRGSEKPGREIDIVTEGWRQDKSSQLSLKEWEAAKRQEWQQKKPAQEFLPWIAGQTWSSQEKGAFEKAYPNQPFDEAKFSTWQREQVDPDLFQPKWLLRYMSGKESETDFQDWKKDVVKWEKKDWEKFKKLTGASDIPFEEYERLSFAYGISGSVDKPERWMLHQIWEKERTKDVSPTKDDFLTFARKLKFTQENPTQKTEEQFQQWIVAQEQALHRRHEGSRLPVTFEKWKSQQDDSILSEPAPFIVLGEKDREVYHTTCEKGFLSRNKYPLNTEFETSWHSGKGYAIFVIGPDKDLYCGSHIIGVFHHSSFLGDAAVVAAGEIKTNPDGSIAVLSSKSGHYRPTDAQNLYTLRYFRDRGVDLSHVKFTSYTAKGEEEERDAIEYLNELEYKEGMGGLDTIDPTIFQ